MTRVQKAVTVKLCRCLCTLFMRAGFLPGHAYYLQAGYTYEEVNDILEQFGENIQEDRHTVEELEYGQWMVVKGSGRHATCAASEGRRGCATERSLKQKQPILSKDGPCVVVLGKRKVNDKWVFNKFQYCLLHECCATVLKSYCDVPPPPTDIIVAPGVKLTKQERMAAGALTFREQL
ncbi:hypothetical protein CYMTET_13510 [Cymbomonas tetramitiformis]|uniref:Uncharacterized protein n=1 Tax=Cymbomonas tetramitiformis TaxID=36881 RepID=A0AAE0LBB2_9CHLO|nr:hypothetical protein CYMTET_13510 [Cymbomonas tetramitiformis]